MNHNNEHQPKYTIAEAPPKQHRSQRRSVWTELLEEARSHPGEWRRVVRPMTKSTATQIASDLRSAAHRDPSKSRLRGLLPIDRWETQWGASPDSAADDFYVWIRYVGSVVRVAV